MHLINARQGNESVVCVVTEGQAVKHMLTVLFLFVSWKLETSTCPDCYINTSLTQVTGCNEIKSRQKTHEGGEQKGDKDRNFIDRHSTMMIFCPKM